MGVEGEARRRAAGGGCSGDGRVAAVEILRANSEQRISGTATGEKWTNDFFRLSVEFTVGTESRFVRADKAGSVPLPTFLLVQVFFS